MQLSELNSECFIQENHESNFLDALGLLGGIYSGNPKTDDICAVLQKHAVGWCDAQRLQYKPMCGYVAVMCEKDGYRFWFHITREMFERILK